MKKEAKKYFLGGKIKIGRLTIHGRDYTHWGLTFWTKKWGYICTRFPLPCFGQFWYWYWYLSPDTTISKSTYFIGKKYDKKEYALARLRKYYLGHNFDIESNKSTVEAIKYFHPGNINEFLDIIRRARAEIKAQTINGSGEFNSLLMSDLDRYITIYGGKK